MVARQVVTQQVGALEVTASARGALEPEVELVLLDHQVNLLLGLVVVENRVEFRLRVVRHHLAQVPTAIIRPED